jgi:predicted kinase
MVCDPGGSPPTLMLITGLPGTGKSTAAEQAAALLEAPVLAHDWAMSGLRPFQLVQNALQSMVPSGHQSVGWSILCALARAQIRRGSSVVLDGVARTPYVEQCREVANQEGARFLMVLTECADLDLHRIRIEARRRLIPNWYELDWDQVQRSRSTWVTLLSADLTLHATDSIEVNRGLLANLIKTDSD